MPYLLNILYLALVAIISPLLLYRSLRAGKYRAGIAEKWLGLVPKRNPHPGPPPRGEGVMRKCIWLHAVSVGEVNLLATLLKSLAAQHPDWDFVISTTSAAGYELAKKKYAPRTVFYCPLDFTWAVKNAMRRIRPDVLLLAELELWPNLVWAAKQHGARVAVFNGRLSERSFRGYRRIRPLVSRVLHGVDLVAAQNEAYAERFRALGAANVEVTGSLKFDGAETDRNNPRTRQLAALAGIKPDDIVFLAGSTQAPEEELALAAFQSLRHEHPRLRLILVPRHPERFAEVDALLDRAGEPYTFRSTLGGSGILPVLPLTAEVTSPATIAPIDARQRLGLTSRDKTDTGETPVPPRVLLVDVVGELGAWWGTAHIGFVGGSLLNSRGGQNMIEPAAYGVATCFGPSTRNFRDTVQQMLDREAAVVVHSGEELAAFVERCLDDRIHTAQLGERARKLVGEQLGATDRTLQLLWPLLNDEGLQVAVKAA